MVIGLSMKRSSVRAMGQGYDCMVRGPGMRAMPTGWTEYLSRRIGRGLSSILAARARSTRTCPVRTRTSRASYSQRRPYVRGVLVPAPTRARTAPPCRAAAATTWPSERGRDVRTRARVNRRAIPRRHGHAGAPPGRDLAQAGFDTGSATTPHVGRVKARRADGATGAGPRAGAQYLLPGQGGATATAHGVADRSHAENVAIRPDRPRPRSPSYPRIRCRYALPSESFRLQPHGCRDFFFKKDSCFTRTFSYSPYLLLFHLYLEACTQLADYMTAKLSSLFFILSSTKIITSLIINPPLLYMLLHACDRAVGVRST